MDPATHTSFFEAGSRFRSGLIVAGGLDLSFIEKGLEGPSFFTLEYLVVVPIWVSTYRRKVAFTHSTDVCVAGL